MSVGYCRDCGREWNGHSEAHCPTCCAHFTSDRAFEKHLAPAESDDICYPAGEKTRKDGSPYFEETSRVHGPAWRVRQDSEHYFSATPSSPESTNKPKRSTSRGEAA